MITITFFVIIASITVVTFESLLFSLSLLLLLLLSLLLLSLSLLLLLLILLLIYSLVGKVSRGH